MASEKKQPNRVIQGYLLAYNGLQCVGWLCVLLLTIRYAVTKRTYVGIWDTVQLLLKIFQTAAVLEIIHGAIRLVPTNPVMAFFQIFSRVLAVWGVLYCVKDAQDSIGVPLLLITWGVTEILRYSFYFLNLLSMVPQFLVWCRYSFFYLLYPMGITGELLCMYAALPYLKHTKLLSIELPNRLNISFSYYYFMILVMVGYIPVFPQLYLHMINQRKKVLHPKKLV